MTEMRFRSGMKTSLLNNFGFTTDFNKNTVTFLSPRFWPEISISCPSNPGWDAYEKTFRLLKLIQVNWAFEMSVRNVQVGFIWLVIKSENVLKTRPLKKWCPAVLNRMRESEVWALNLKCQFCFNQHLDDDIIGTFHVVQVMWHCITCL